MLDHLLMVRVFLDDDDDPIDSEGFAHFYFSYRYGIRCFVSLVVKIILSCSQNRRI